MAGLGHIHQIRGELSEADACLTESLALARAVGSPLSELNVLPALGHVYRTLRRYSESLAWFTEAANLADTMGEPNGNLEAALGIGLVRHAMGPPRKPSPTWSARWSWPSSSSRRWTGHARTPVSATPTTRSATPARPAATGESALSILTGLQVTQVEEVTVDELAALLGER